MHKVVSTNTINAEADRTSQHATNAAHLLPCQLPHRRAGFKEVKRGPTCNVAFTQFIWHTFHVLFKKITLIKTVLSALVMWSTNLTESFFSCHISIICAWQSNSVSWAAIASYSRLESVRTWCWWQDGTQTTIFLWRWTAQIHVSITNPERQRLLPCIFLWKNQHLLKGLMHGTV